MDGVTAAWHTVAAPGGRPVLGARQGEGHGPELAFAEKHFDFTDSSGGHGAGTGGMVAVSDREGAFGKTGRSLMAFHNDSFHEALLAAYQSGLSHGEKVGAERARKAVRDVLAAADGGS